MVQTPASADTKAPEAEAGAGAGACPSATSSIAADLVPGRAAAPTGEKKGVDGGAAEEGPRERAGVPGSAPARGSAAAASTFSIGPGMAIDLASLHGRIRNDVAHNLRSMGGVGVDDLGVAVVQGGQSQPVYTTDGESIFRQEAYFHYLFGVREPGCWGSLDVRTGASTLFVPRVPAAHAVWLGAQPEPSDWLARYGVDAVRYVDELAATLAEVAPPSLHVLAGVNTDSGLAFDPPTFPGAERFRLETKALHRTLTESRVVKRPQEVAVMRYAAGVASRAHVEAMRGLRAARARPGGLWEYQIEADFLASIYRDGGCRHVPYTSIVGSGPNAAILHYGHAGAPNDRQVRDGDLVLLDAGAEYHRYASDVTTTFPASGVFSPLQRAVYEAVLDAQRAALAVIRPSVGWVDVHLEAERALLVGLQRAGILTVPLEVDARVSSPDGDAPDGDAADGGAAGGDGPSGSPAPTPFGFRRDYPSWVSRAQRLRIPALFMPHGLGHLLGIDTHDVGGYVASSPARPVEAGLRALRTARNLEECMVITVEPGCYFVPSLLEPALTDPGLAPWLDEAVVRRCIDEVGGVRLEDDVVVTPEGPDVLNDVPRDVEDVEWVCAGGEWPRENRGRSEARTS